jgi:hypothetical protein
MTYEQVPASFVPLEGTKLVPINYNILDTKYIHDYVLQTKYKIGQQYIVSDEKPLAIVSLLLESVFDELKANTPDPTKKIVIENHRRIANDLLKNLYDSEITVDLKNIIGILDGVIYANTKQYYKKDSGGNG